MQDSYSNLKTKAKEVTGFHYRSEQRFRKFLIAMFIEDRLSAFLLIHGNKLMMIVNGKNFMFCRIMIDQTKLRKTWTSRRNISKWLSLKRRKKMEANYSLKESNCFNVVFKQIYKTSYYQHLILFNFISHHHFWT